MRNNITNVFFDGRLNGFDLFVFNNNIVLTNRKSLKVYIMSHEEYLARYGRE